MLDKIKKALEGQELDFNLDDLHVMPKNDYTSLIEGHKNELEDVKSKSQKIGQEILLKELKNDIGLDYEQRKNPENLKKAFIDKFGKSDDADIAQLQSNFDKLLSEKDNEIQSIKDGYKRDSDNRSIKESLIKEFSKFADKTNYKVEDLVVIAQNKNEFGVFDGNVLLSKDGEPIKNETYQTLNAERFVSNMMKDEGYIKPVEGGKIIGDKTKGGKYTMEEFISSQEAQGVNSNSLEFSKNLESAVSDGNIEL